MPTINFDRELDNLKSRIKDNPDITEKNKELILEYLKELRLNNYSKARTNKLGQHMKRIAEENSLDDFSPHIDFVEWVENEEVINDYEINYMTKCGNKIPMSVSASVTRDENDSLKNIVCVAKDIRERK